MEKVKHVAITMDGNGRWAKAQGKSRSDGHYYAIEVVRQVAIEASDLGVEVLTLFAFSTENWKRSKEEIDFLMKLPSIFFAKFLNELMEKNIKITMIGEFDGIPQDTTKVLKKAIDQTSKNTGMILNFAMNYGSQREIVLACQKYTDDVIQKKRDNDLTISEFNDYLMTKDFPDLDLLIRTSGEYRISNFLLWQLAYSELMFISKPWPEFTREDFRDCIDNFKNRNRRFGGVN